MDYKRDEGRAEDRGPRTFFILHSHPDLFCHNSPPCKHRHPEIPPRKPVSTFRQEWQYRSLLPPFAGGGKTLIKGGKEPGREAGEQGAGATGAQAHRNGTHMAHAHMW